MYNRKEVIVVDNKVRYSSFENKFEIIYRNEAPSIQMPPHTHNAIELYVNLTPLPSILLGDNVMSLDKDTLLIIPSYCIHQFTQQLDHTYERYIITISTDWFENLISDNKRYSYFTDTGNPMVIQLNDKKELLLERMQDFIQCKDNDTFIKISVFFDILKIIDGLIYTQDQNYDRKERITGTQQTVNQIIKYINTHLVENIRLTDIAERFYLTPNHISRIFKKHTNTQISNYIILQRMTMAKQLFRKGFTVTEVQTATGYSSYEHFFRTFKKNVGMTPKEYINTYYNHE